jgi:hypothetical protein
MAVPNDNISIHLERKIAPKMRVGIEIAVIAAGLLIFFTPRAGLLKNAVPERISLILTLLALAMLVCAGVVVIYLPAYYRKLSKLMRDETPTLMRVTVKEDSIRGQILAELRGHESGEDAPVQMVVRVLDKVDVPPNFPAEVYQGGQQDQVVIQTVHGILWPVPDERQQKLEELFRVRS